MLSSVLWPSDKPRDETDYDFVYPMHLNMSEQGQFSAYDKCIRRLEFGNGRKRSMVPVNIVLIPSKLK